MPLIAIDGPSGAGKSTLAAALATELQVSRLDTGAMYRAVGLAALQHDIDLDDEAALVAIATTMTLEMGDVVTLFGKDVTDSLRDEAVSAAASRVAAKPGVRRELVRRQREWIERHRGGVVEGRDIASVVAPHADVKVFLTADLDERGRRRTVDLENNTEKKDGVDEQSVVESLLKRDVRDTTRDASPLVVVDGALVIDSTNRSVDDIVKEVLSYL